MYWITMIISFCFLGLLYFARKEETGQGTASVLKPFYKIAMYLYKKTCRHFPKLFSSPQVEKDLVQLHPGESRECLKTQYYVRKAALCMAVILAGTLFGAACRFSAQEKIILGEDGAIHRLNYQEGEREINVAADYGQQQMDFRVKIEPRLLPEAEIEALTEELRARLPEYILGRNESLGCVTEDLVLREHYGEFPVFVKWESSSPGSLSDTGQVFTIEDEEDVIIKAYLSYGGYEQTEELHVRLMPQQLTEEEERYRQMEELLIRSQSDSVREAEWRLPASWQGEEIQWRQIVEDNSLLMWAGTLVVSVLVFIFLDKDLHEQLEKRKKSLRREYPEIVHKLVLFVGAGMTIRGAFQKIAGDYEVKRRNGGRFSPAYEEMLYTCRELYSGISEGLSYEHFGKRTGLQEYVKLSALLAQNLKRGNSTLMERLREEAEKSAEERLQQSKKMGEEAGTKLLVPMVLMLVVVMAIIMLPAFSNM